MRNQNRSPLLAIIATLACSCTFDYGALEGRRTDAGGGDAGRRPSAGEAGATSPDSNLPHGGTTDAGGGDSLNKPGASEAGAASPDTLPPAQCPPRSTGGVACPGGKCAVGSYAGSSFASSDDRSSTVCLSASSLCASGTTNSLGSPDTSTNWGATFGFYLVPTSTPSESFEVQLAGTGVTVTLSNLPTRTQARVVVTTGNFSYSVNYCAVLTSASQVVPWNRFNTACWDDSGMFLGAAPSAKALAVQVASEAGVAGTFDLCVTALTL